MLILHNMSMSDKRREDMRYDTVARVESPEISAIPGKLMDISLRGCKIGFPVPLLIDLENEYTLKIKILDNSGKPELILICCPIWLVEQKGVTEIGMRILRSPDTNRLNEYVKQLRRSAAIDEDPECMIVDPVCEFI